MVEGSGQQTTLGNDFLLPIGKIIDFMRLPKQELGWYSHFNFRFTSLSHTWLLLFFLFNALLVRVSFLGLLYRKSYQVTVYHEIFCLVIIFCCCSVFK